jgi:predicted MFS family arabinose efflux permease
MNGVKRGFFNHSPNQRLFVKNKAISYRTLLGKPGFAGLLFAVSIGRLASGLILFGLIPNSFKKENFNEANASIGAAYNLGSGSGAMLAGVLVEQMSMRTSFLGSVTLPLVATITAATFARIAMYSRK